MSDTVETPAATPAPPVIGIEDLAIYLQIIDAFAQRGNIRGDELSLVGKARDNLAAFLKYVDESRRQKEEQEKAAVGPTAQG